MPPMGISCQPKDELHLSEVSNPVGCPSGESLSLGVSKQQLRTVNTDRSGGGECAGLPGDLALSLMLGSQAACFPTTEKGKKLTDSY